MAPLKTKSVSKPRARPAVTEPSTSMSSPTTPQKIRSSVVKPTQDSKSGSRSCERAKVTSDKKSAVNATFNICKNQGSASEIKENQTSTAPPRAISGSNASGSKKTSSPSPVKKDRMANNRIFGEEQKKTFLPTTAASVASEKAQKYRPTPSPSKQEKKTSISKDIICNTKVKFPRDQEKQHATTNPSNARLRRPSPKREVRNFVKILPATKDHRLRSSVCLQDIGFPAASINKHLTSHSEAPVNSSPIENSCLQGRPVPGHMTSHSPVATRTPRRMVNTNIPTNPVANGLKTTASNSFSQRARTANHKNSNSGNSRRTPVVVGLPNIQINSVAGRTRVSENPLNMITKFKSAQDQYTSNRCDSKNPHTVNNHVTTHHGAKGRMTYAPQDSSNKPVTRAMRERSGNTVFAQRRAQLPGDNPKNDPPSGTADKCITPPLVKQPDDSHRSASKPMCNESKPVQASRSVSQPAARNTRDTPSTLVDQTNFQPVSQASFQSGDVHQSNNSTSNIDAKEIMTSSNDEPNSFPQGSGDDATKPPSNLQSEAIQLASSSEGTPSKPLNQSLHQTPSTAMNNAKTTASASLLLKGTKSQPMAGAGGAGTEVGTHVSIQGPAQAESQSTSNAGPSDDKQDEKIPSNPRAHSADAAIEVNFPYGRIRTMKMTKKDMNRHIPVWNSRLQYKLAGTSAPLGKNLVAYLERKMGEYELYDNQDRGQHRRENSGGTRVTLWNKVELRKISGTSAPLRKNLEKYLKEHPYCEVYEDQAERMHPSERSRLQNQNRVTLWNKVLQRRTGFGSAGPLRKNLRRYLERHPDLEEYKGQDKKLEEAKADPAGDMDEQKSEFSDDGGIGQTLLHQADERWHVQSPCGKRSCDSSIGNEQSQENQDKSPSSSIPARSPKRHCPIDLSLVPDLNQFPIIPTDRPAYPREWYENYYRITESSEEEILMAPLAILGADGHNTLAHLEGGSHTPETDIEEFFRQQLAAHIPQPEVEPFVNLEEEPNPATPTDSPKRDEFNPDDFLNLDADVESILREDDNQDQGNSS